MDELFRNQHTRWRFPHAYDGAIQPKKHVRVRVKGGWILEVECRCLLLRCQSPADGQPFLLFFPSDLQFQFEVGLLIAATLSSLVCLSRLYTGMHSVLVSESTFPLSVARTHAYTRTHACTRTQHKIFRVKTASIIHMCLFKLCHRGFDLAFVMHTAPL